jgi:hypothetical protein
MKTRYSKFDRKVAGKVVAIASLHGEAGKQELSGEEASSTAMLDAQSE